MKKPFLKHFPRFFFSSLWALAIFCLFVFDFSESAKDLPLIPYADKIAHALLFFVQTGLLLWNSIVGVLPPPVFLSAVYFYGRYRFRFYTAF